MKKLFLGLLISVLSTPIQASTFVISKIVDKPNLQYELGNAGFFVTNITTAATSVIISLDPSDTKDPTAVVNAHIFTAPETASAARTERMNALILKLRLGTATTAEKDELLLRLTLETLSL